MGKNLEMTYKNNVLSYKFNNVQCASYQYSLTEFQLMMRAFNKGDGVALITVSDLNMVNSDSS